MATHSGGCLCGGIRYEIDGALPDAIVCHCSICRKAFNGGGSYVSWMNPDAFRWLEGEDLLQTFANQRGFALGFCGTCGSTLCGIHQDRVRFVTLGSLNDAPDVKIAAHAFVDSKAPWDEIGGSAPQFPAHAPKDRA